MATEDDVPYQTPRRYQRSDDREAHLCVCGHGWLWHIGKSHERGCDFNDGDCDCQAFLRYTAGALACQTPRCGHEPGHHKAGTGACVKENQVHGRAERYCPCDRYVGPQQAAAQPAGGRAIRLRREE